MRACTQRLPNRLLSSAKIRISRVQKQIYLRFAEAKYLRRSQNTKKPGQTQPESDFIQAKSKIVKSERKRELVPSFPRRILFSTKIVKAGGIRKFIFQLPGDILSAGKIAGSAYKPPTSPIFRGAPSAPRRPRESGAGGGNQIPCRFFWHIS